jgi:predicted CoA-binding protein
MKKKKQVLSAKEKKFLKDFDKAVEFVNLYQQGKVKAKTIDQLLQMDEENLTSVDFRFTQKGLKRSVID